jgi:hypothetical protein
LKYSTFSGIEEGKRPPRRALPAPLAQTSRTSAPWHGCTRQGRRSRRRARSVRLPGDRKDSTEYQYTPTLLPSMLRGLLFRERLAFSFETCTVTYSLWSRNGPGTAKRSLGNDRGAYVLRYSCPAKVVGESRKGSKGRSSRRPPKVKGSRQRWLPRRISQAKGP